MIRRLLPLILALAAVPATAADLDIEVEGISTQRGRLVVFVFDSRAAWDAQREPVRRERMQPDGDGGLRLRLAGLPPGEYGVMVLHDTDGNGTFDTGPFGIPRDDYGFSNNPVVFSKPRFERVRFALPATGARIRIRMH